MMLFLEVPVRTTIDIPEREHTLYTSLARAQRTSFSKLLLDLARRGLESANRVADAVPVYRVDPQTGLGVFRSGRPVTLDDVKALEDDDAPCAREAS
ncbi:MAG: antitoxin [Betaproteobacteria bacterium]|nr:antitoxin [Betaproteobacteria bacterium]